MFLGLCCPLSFRIFLVAFRAIAKRWVAPNTVLEVDLRGAEIRETPQPGGLLGMLQPSSAIHVHTLVRTLQRAAKDTRISGLVVTMDRFKANLTELAEIRDAVLALRTAGKKTILHSNTFNEIGASTIYYWFATAFEEVYMSTIGTLSLTGLKFQPFFLRGLLVDKLCAEPLLTARREYKNAANIFMESQFTPAHKESVESMMTTLLEQFANDIAAARGLSTEAVKELLSGGPYSAERAHELKLIDGVVYEDEFYDSVVPAKFKVQRSFFSSIIALLFDPCPLPGQPQGVPLLFANHFYKRSGGSPYASGKNKVAYINILGTIHMGKSEEELDGTPTSAGADTIVLALRQAIADKKVKAIILRVVSGGGSAVASDMIAQQVVAAKAAGKKVIVSMGQYAASGGYYVSCYADKIVAAPLTFTGSIGVIAGKLNMRQTMGKVGVTFDSVQSSSNADMYDAMTGYNAENREKLEAWVDDLYEKFKGHVAAGRKMSDEQVEALAKGRVWMGTKALQLGLVDVLGNLETAIQITKTELGLKENEQITLVSYPRQGGLMDALKKPHNSRELAKAQAPSVPLILASWFLPASWYRSISTASRLWSAVNAISARPELRQLVQQADFSNFPAEISMGPSFIDTSVIGAAEM